MNPEKIVFQPTYTKENGLSLIDLKGIPLPNKETFTLSCLITIPIKQYGGNHKHPRIEAFVAFGDGMHLQWLDEKNELQIEA